MKRALAIAAILAAGFGLLGYSAPSWGADQTSTSGKVTTIKSAHKTSANRHAKKNVKKKNKSSKKSLRKEETTTGLTTGTTTNQNSNQKGITPATPGTLTGK